MKCEFCPACEVSYEYGEFSCSAGYEDESIEFPDGLWGCRHPRNNIEKRIALHIDGWAGYGEWLFAREGEK